MAHVIHAFHHDSEAEGRQENPTPNPAAEVMAAVRQEELRINREQIVADVQERALPAIEAAVKRAMEGAKSRAPTTKKKRKQHTFQNKGNERRHDANEEMLNTIEEALDEIGAKDLEAAKKSLETGRKLLSKRQRLIKMADREDNGWEVVRHYVSDDLADDSNDEKDIKRARREALDTECWGIDKSTFEYIEGWFGPFDVDRFADDMNKKLPNFNSKYYCIGTKHVNTFTTDWKGKNN